MILQLKDLLPYTDDGTIFIDDRTNGKFQILPTKQDFLEKKEWLVIYINAEMHNYPAEDEPIMCVGVVEKLGDENKLIKK
ncbi:MAG: hypothetical protein IKG56_01460 [Clostridia bacterium]|nr:hypothetical protein [Clostridia bacterium]